MQNRLSNALPRPNPRRTIGLLSLLILLVCVSTVPPASARIGERWKITRIDPFLRFYRTDTAAHFVAGVSTLRPWAKHYQLTCPLVVSLSNDSIVTGLELRLDRETLDTGDWIAMRDIAKNFVRHEVGAGDDSLIDNLANEIQYPMDRNVFYPGDVPTLPNPPTKAYQAFLGNIPTYTLKLSRSQLTLTNVEIGGRKWLVMKLGLEAMLGPRG